MSEDSQPSLHGPKARRKGTSITNGVAFQVVTYPRARTKAALVEASEILAQSLSGFLIIAGLEKAARLKSRATGQKYTAQDLVPEEEYAELLRKRGGKSKG